MKVRSYNLRRAEAERQRAIRALTEEARRTHLELAAIFEARAEARAAGAAADGEAA
jgi:hypothetical protein